MNLAKASKTIQFWVEDGLLVTRGNQLYVLRVGEPKEEIITRVSRYFMG